MNTDNTLASPHTGALILRVSLGTILLAHGLMKFVVFGPEGTVGFFASLGLPAAAAWLTMLGEVAGGTALILGLYTRLTALLSLPILLGAIWAHSGNGWVFSNTGGGWEFPVLLVVMAATVALQGPGRLAIRGPVQVSNLLPAALRA